MKLGWRPCGTNGQTRPWGGRRGRVRRGGLDAEADTCARAAAEGGTPRQGTEGHLQGGVCSAPNGGLAAARRAGGGVDVVHRLRQPLPRRRGRFATPARQMNHAARRAASRHAESAGADRHASREREPCYERHPQPNFRRWALALRAPLACCLRGRCLGLDCRSHVARTAADVLCAAQLRSTTNALRMQCSRRAAPVAPGASATLGLVLL